MKPADKSALVRNPLQRSPSHARHDGHVENNVGAVGDLHSAAGQRGVNGPHAIRHNVQRAVLHAAAEQSAHLGTRLDRVHPVVVRTCVFLLRRTDVGKVLDSCDIVWIRTGEVAAWKRLRIEWTKIPVAYHAGSELPNLGVRTIAPVDSSRLCKLTYGVHPVGHVGAELGQRSNQVCSSGHPTVLYYSESDAAFIRAVYRTGRSPRTPHVVEGNYSRVHHDGFINRTKPLHLFHYRTGGRHWGGEPSARSWARMAPR